MRLAELTSGLAAWSTDPDGLTRVSIDRSGAVPDGLPDLVVFAKSVDDVRRTVAHDQTHRTAAAVIVRFLERLRLGADLPTIDRVERLHRTG